MADREIFRSDYPNGPNIPTGELLNAYSRMLNSIGGGLGGSGLNYSGASGQASLPPPVFIGLARITDNGNSGGFVAQGGERDAPNSDNHKYSVNIRYWDHGDNVWRTHDTGLTRMDAGGYHGGTAGAGPLPRYKVGDVVPVWFDAQRNWCVAIHSPPEQVGGYIFRAQNDVQPRKVRSATYVDTVQVNLEVRRGQKWFKYFPELCLAPSHSYRSGASASVPLIIAIRHRDEFRMTCGTNRFTTAGLRVYEYGFRMTTLGRLEASGGTTGLGEMTGANKNFTPMDGLQQIGNSQLRFADEPTFTAINNTIRVEMRNPFEQWLVAVDYWAEVDNVGPHGVFVMVTDSNGGTTGALVEPESNINGLGITAHYGYVLAANSPGGLSTAFRCYLQFVDFGVGGVSEGLAYTGRIYGPCQLNNFISGADDANSLPESQIENPDRPLYMTTQGDQEYLAKRSAETSKGNSGEYTLYHPDRQPSTIRKTAMALANKVPANKWAIVRRLQRVWYVSPWECE
jgi:hypothetical protein